MWFYQIVIGILINTINIPFDNGANILGSNKAPAKLENSFNFLDINKKVDINCEEILSGILFQGYREVKKSLEDDKLPIIVGGDHTISACSVAASNEFCLKKNETLGVLWCDAHADFNTILTSSSKNIHGMPVAILCGHTLQSISNGPFLNPWQFGYYGLRDIDCLELLRFQQFNMNVLEEKDIDDWLELFDKVHVSFDLDCIDPCIFNSVNTPVENGKSKIQIKHVFKKIKNSKKLQSLDIVEFNPDKGDEKDIIEELVKELF
tara:strand:+ start:3345 stop:4136 length:792 start_codon:yes stop_codon:yes gene_type:complete